MTEYKEKIIEVLSSMNYIGSIGRSYLIVTFRQNDKFVHLECSIVLKVEKIIEGKLWLNYYLPYSHSYDLVLGVRQKEVRNLRYWCHRVICTVNSILKLYLKCAHKNESFCSLTGFIYAALWSKGQGPIRCRNFSENLWLAVFQAF